MLNTTGFPILFFLRSFSPGIAVLSIPTATTPATTVPMMSVASAISLLPPFFVFHDSELWESSQTNSFEGYSSSSFNGYGY